MIGEAVATIARLVVKQEQERQHREPNMTHVANLEGLIEQISAPLDKLLLPPEANETLRQVIDRISREHWL